MFKKLRALPQNQKLLYFVGITAIYLFGLFFVYELLFPANSEENFDTWFYMVIGVSLGWFAHKVFGAQPKKP
jgi:membrane associated rhomboid family serine protease